MKVYLLLRRGIALGKVVLGEAFLVIAKRDKFANFRGDFLAGPNGGRLAVQLGDACIGATGPESLCRNNVFSLTHGRGELGGKARAGSGRKGDSRNSGAEGDGTEHGRKLSELRGGLDSSYTINL